MTALAANKNRLPERFRTLELTLTLGEHAYQGSRAVIVDGAFEVAVAGKDLFSPGHFQREYDATSAAKKASVDVGREVVAFWWSNATGTDAGSATTVGKLVYFTDDNTVSPVSTDRSLAGRCWGYDSDTNRLLVERLDPLT